MSMVSPRVKKWANTLRTLSRSLRGISRAEEVLEISRTRKTISPRERVERMRKLERLQFVRGRVFSPLDEAHFKLRQHIHENGVPSFHIEHPTSENSIRLGDVISLFVRGAIRNYQLTQKQAFTEELPFYNHYTRFPTRAGTIKMIYDAPHREFMVRIIWSDEDAASDYRFKLFPTIGKWDESGEKTIWELSGKISREDEKMTRTAYVKQKMVGEKRDEYVKRYGKK